MKFYELQPELELVEVVAAKEDKTDLQKHIEQTYQKLGDKCDKILEKLEKRKAKK